MKTNLQFRLLLALLLTSLTAPLMAQDIKNPLFRIAPTEYATMAEKSMNLLAAANFDAWGAMLADNVEFDFPDGDALQRQQKNRPLRQLLRPHTTRKSDGSERAGRSQSKKVIT